MHHVLLHLDAKLRQMLNDGSFRECRSHDLGHSAPYHTGQMSPGARSSSLTGDFDINFSARILDSQKQFLIQVISRR